MTDQQKEQLFGALFLTTLTIWACAMLLSTRKSL